MAAKSLIHLYRMENPTLLDQKDRGKWQDMAFNYEYGEVKAETKVKGLELLAQERELIQIKLKNLCRAM
eukprot:UN09573